MGFDWKLANVAIDMLGVRNGDVVLDPFAGAGTTLVQCKKRGINAIGIDANPVCILASKVKTTWSLSPATLKRLLSSIVSAAKKSTEIGIASEDAPLAYLKKSGMIDRGWLSLHKAKLVLALRKAIRRAPMSSECREFFNLALVSALVTRISDIKFGPEVYCLREPRRLPVISSFIAVAQMMIDDLAYAKGLQRDGTSAHVFLGDARADRALRCAAPDGVDYVITSPPYPNEHDYTRTTRLELIVLDHVASNADLQRIKREMLRCTTKGIYKGDSDAAHCRGFSAVEAIACALDRRSSRYTDGFSKLYGRMVREYFGGMALHLRAVKQVLKPGGRCAYIVRDTQSLLGIYIDTPKMLAMIATSPDQGFQLDEVVEWKRVKGTTGRRMLSEKIMVLRAPK